jgi:hypothetical protein
MFSTQSKELHSTKIQTDHATEIQTAQEKQTTGVVDTRYAHRSLTRQELDAAHNSVAGSKHTKITLIPNHCLNMEGELEGFCLSALLMTQRLFFLCQSRHSAQ